MEGDIVGVFPYPGRDTDSPEDDLFAAVAASSTLTTTVEGKRIAFADNTNISFPVSYPEYEPDYEGSVSYTPALPCLVFVREAGGVLYASEPGRDEYVDLFVEIYRHLPDRPPAGYLMSSGQQWGLADPPGGIYHPVTEESLAKNEFNDGAWVMVFPPAMVERYGRETLHDLSVRRVEDLEDGSVVTVAPGDPTMYTQWGTIAEELSLAGAKQRE